MVGASHPPGRCHRRKKSPYLRTSSSLNMAVRGGLIRFAHRYSARPWASPLRGQRRRCSKMLPAFLCGQPARRLAVCPAGCASCRPPIGASHPPGRCHRRKKSPYLRTSSSLNMAVRRGLTRFARSTGSPLAYSRSVQLAMPAVDPRSGFLIPPGGATGEKKARTCVRALL